MILMLSFCGCTNVGSNRNEYMSNWFKSEQEISDNMMKQIIDLYLSLIHISEPTRP